jgi:hypothetical protein
MIVVGVKRPRSGPFRASMDTEHSVLFIDDIRATSRFSLLLFFFIIIIIHCDSVTSGRVQRDFRMKKFLLGRNKNQRNGLGFFSHLYNGYAIDVTNDRNFSVCCAIACLLPASPYNLCPSTLADLHPPHIDMIAETKAF